MPVKSLLKIPLEPKRLPERRAVTIIAGFRAVDGIVLCGDTQETVANLSKRHVTKLKVEPEEAAYEIVRTSDLAFSFCGSGNGPFIDVITRRAGNRVRQATNVDDACMSAENSITETYEEYGRIYQPGQCPEVEIIYGIKMNGESRLFQASGPMVNPIDTYCSAGAGYYMADFLASRMYSNELDVSQCVILASYILFQAKEHVDGCGGESHIGVLRNGGTSGMVEYNRVQIFSEMANRIDLRLMSVLLAAVNMRTEDARDILPTMALENLKDDIQLERKHARKRIAEHDSWYDLLLPETSSRDELGFLRRSISRTSEGPQ
jgi:20S proteasome alpha/beta subunit